DDRSLATRSASSAIASSNRPIRRSSAARSEASLSSAMTIEPGSSLPNRKEARTSASAAPQKKNRKVDARLICTLRPSPRARGPLVVPHDAPDRIELRDARDASGHCDLQALPVPDHLDQNGRVGLPFRRQSLETSQIHDAPPVIHDDLVTGGDPRRLRLRAGQHASDLHGGRHAHGASITLVVRLAELVAKRPLDVVQALDDERIRIAASGLTILLDTGS